MPYGKIRLEGKFHEERVESQQHFDSPINQIFLNVEMFAFLCREISNPLAREGVAGVGDEGEVGDACFLLMTSLKGDLGRF